MNGYKNDLIEYKGVADYIPKSIKSKKEFSIEEIIIINKDIEEVLKVSVNGVCEDTRKIKTPKAISIDGIRLTGRKLLVNSNFSIRIEYIESNFKNKVYLIKRKINYLTSIILEDEDAIKRKNIVTIFIEEILARKINDTDILVSIYGVIGVE